MATSGTPDKGCESPSFRLFREGGVLRGWLQPVERFCCGISAAVRLNSEGMGRGAWRAASSRGGTETVSVGIAEWVMRQAGI
jgi:hypothetical protein